MEHIKFGFSETPFGEIIAARSPLGYRDIQFLTYYRTEVIHELGTRWGVYTPTERDDKVAQFVKEVFFDRQNHPFILDLRGTEFQKQVWREVRMVPFGETATYQEIANRIGHPEEVRAVASAILQNPLALLIPCHRIVRNDGSVGEYHWGTDLKKKLIEWEKEVKKNEGVKKV
ncbi:MAG: methylated-DNA--[protein]-cysteine S-methyltransferase [Prevotella sp.]|jgi:AraC family transcriptional regulator of adaptative response/methylated-DNA-[protein]-cysteine methyltransferase